MEPKPYPSPERINQIGHLLLRNEGVENSKLLLFAEFDDDWMGADIRLLPDGATQLRQAFPGQEMTDVLMNTWEEARDGLGEGAWRGLMYVLDHGQVDITLLYPEELGTVDDHIKNLNGAFARIFPGLEVERVSGWPPKF